MTIDAYLSEQLYLLVKKKTLKFGENSSCVQKLKGYVCLCPVLLILGKHNGCLAEQKR